MATKKLTQAEQDLIYHCNNCGKLKDRHEAGTLRCPVAAAEGAVVTFHAEHTYQLILRYRCKHCGDFARDHQGLTANCPIKSSRGKVLDFHTEQKYEPTEENPEKVRFLIKDSQI